MLINVFFLFFNIIFTQITVNAYSRELNTAVDYFTETYKYVVSDATNTATSIRSVYAIDVDGDGYVDLLSASRTTNEIAWWKNDGTESFTKYVITTDTSQANCVYAIDVDGDGDIDVVSASQGDDKIAWFENDGSESFATHENSTAETSARWVFAIDIDGDEDIDILSVSYNDNTIALWVNDGSESFTKQVFSTLYARYVYAADIDGDSDIDILSVASRGGGSSTNLISWWENTGSLSFSQHTITTSASGVPFSCEDDIYRYKRNVT